MLRYLPTNLTAPEIARELSISPNTAKTHIRHVYAKLGAHYRAEAVEHARVLGLLAPAGRLLARESSPGRSEKSKALCRTAPRWPANLSRPLARAVGSRTSPRPHARTPAQSVPGGYASNESELAWPARRFLTCSSKLSLPNRETPSAIDEHSASSVS